MKSTVQRQMEPSENSTTPGRYYYVSGTGWFVCRARTKRQAFTAGVEEYGVGGTKECRRATEEELREYLRLSGKTVNDLDDEME